VRCLYEQPGEGLTTFARRGKIHCAEKLPFVERREPNELGNSGPAMPLDDEEPAFDSVREIAFRADPRIAAVTAGFAQQSFVVEKQIGR